MSPCSPVASHVGLWPSVHVRRTLESCSLALLHHGRLRVGHARREQRALWSTRASETPICLLAHTCRAGEDVKYTGSAEKQLQNKILKITEKTNMWTDVAEMMELI